MEAHKHRDGTLGHRARGRLAESEDFEDLMLLADLDKKGRRRGVQVCGVEEAVEFVRALAQENG